MADVQIMRGRVSASVWQDWTSIFGWKNYNWSTFCLISINSKRTRYRGSGCDAWEIHLALLGFHFMLYVWDGEGDRVWRPVREEATQHRKWIWWP